MKIGAKIRRLRKLRGLTIEDVATGADLTKGFISQVERDMNVPSVLNLKQILDVLGVDLATFFSDLEVKERNVYSKKDRIEEEKNRDYRIEGLIPRLKYLEMEPLLLSIAPNASYIKTFEEDEGFGFVVRGKLDLKLDSEERILTKGDCFYIFFDNQLSIQNLTNKTAEILLVYY